jgi:dihydrofolate reductase
MSLDGYVMVPPTDGFFDAHHLDRQRAADTLLLGATTYRSLKAYWPAVADDPAMSPAVQEAGRRITEMRKVVVSDSLNEADTAPWTATTTIVRRTDAHEAVAALEAPRRDILMVGSQTWPDLLVAEVDELYVTLGAAVGGGTAFGTGPVPPLHLLEVTRRELVDRAAAVRGGRRCRLVIVDQCSDRQAAEHRAGGWRARSSPGNGARHHPLRRARRRHAEHASGVVDAGCALGHAGVHETGPDHCHADVVGPQRLGQPV